MVGRRRATGEENVIKDAYTLEDTTEATRFGEGYPLGNGQIGAMVYGTVPVNRIVFSENTFFSGCYQEQNLQPYAAQAFREMRKASSRGDYAALHRAAQHFIGVRNSYGTNLPVGELQIRYGEATQETGQLRLRRLEIEEGIASRKLEVAGRNGELSMVREECFCSHPEHAFVLRMHTEDKPVSMQIAFADATGYGQTTCNGKVMNFLVCAYEKMHCDSLCGVHLLGKVFVTTDGTISSKDGHALDIEHATLLTLCVVMATDFEHPVLTAQEVQANATTPDLDEIAARMRREYEPGLCKRMEEIWQKDYLCLRQRHCQDTRERMERVEFQLSPSSGQDRAEHQEELLRTTFLYQYGRYLLQASSREDSSLPAHLQGIWNDNVACRIGWTCDMHLDINTQMNYWIAENTDLPETLPPLARWIQERLVPEGTKTARDAYGYPGWVGEIVSNAWGYAAPYWATPIAPCPTGGVWILTQLWEDYLYHGEKEKLAEDVMPLIRGAMQFFTAYVYEEDGVLVSGPSISPENSFIKDGEKYQISSGPTYEILMIRELFQIFQKACEALYGKQDAENSRKWNETDLELYEKTGEMLEHLLPYRVLADGTIAEYRHDLRIPDRQHRHTSHLLGLFPFAQITPEKTPELAEAAEKTLQSKLTPEDNWEDTGWARSMLLLYEARLRHGEEAYRHQLVLQTKLLEPNALVFHPPTRGAGAFDHVYELDGNTGFTAGVTEMLLQSHEEQIRLLPALPEAWSCGKITGLKARGNLLVSISWEHGELTECILTAAKERDYLLCYKNQMRSVHLLPDKATKIQFE